MLKVIGFRYIEKNLDGKGSGGGRGSVYKTVSVRRELCGFWRDKENVYIGESLISRSNSR